MRKTEIQFEPRMEKQKFQKNSDDAYNNLKNNKDIIANSQNTDSDNRHRRTPSYENYTIQNTSLQMRTGKAGSPGNVKCWDCGEITIGVDLSNSEEWRTQVLCCSRIVNKITKQMAYILVLLRKATCFYTLDLKAGYCQPALDEVDK